MEEEGAALSREAAVVEKELQNATLLLQEQEEGELATTTAGAEAETHT